MGMESNATQRRATHNGTCQACGRVQAVIPRTGKLAKHGYTVDWGYFDGVCYGSDELPVEHGTDVLDRTAANLTAQAETADAYTVDTIPAVTYREFKGYHGKRQHYETHRFTTEAEWGAFRKTRNVGGTWASQCRAEVERFKSFAERCRTHVAFLAQLKSNRYGQPLFPRS